MTGLVKLLRNQGFDLIDGPIRSHAPLQIWNKVVFEKNTFYGNLMALFKSDVKLEAYRDAATYVNSSEKETYGFNVGLSASSPFLKEMGLDAFDFGSKISGGQSLSVSFDNAYTLRYAKGELSTFFYDPSTDFAKPNPELLNNANRNNLILISGVLYAENMIIEMKSNNAISADVVSDMAKVAKANVSYAHTSDNSIKMTSQLDKPYPIAIEAVRLDFDKGKYVSMKVVTDNRGDLF